MISGPNIQPKRKLRGKFNISGRRGLEPSGSDVPSTSKRRYELRSMVATTGGDGGLDLSESAITPRRKRMSKRTKSIMLEDSSDGEPDNPVLNMTHSRKLFLQDLVDRLLRENEEDSEPFAQPVDAIAEGIPEYHTEITRAMDLQTLKKNLGKRFYITVKDFEADFTLMIENSIRFNGPRHKVSQAGLRLQRAFNALMVTLPGRD